jgi:ribosome-binding factor A
MSKGTSRTRRVGDLIQIELAKILQEEMPNSPFGLFTVLEVQISPDLSHAKVFMSVLNPEKARELIEVLNRNAKSLRFELTQRVKLRIAPLLKFIYDDSATRGHHISMLIDQALKEKNPK